MDMTTLDTYKSLLQRALTSVSQAVGTHVMLIVFQHALWSTRLTYEEAGLIGLSEDGVSFDELDRIDPERAKLVIDEFVSAIIVTLSRLVGQRLADQLTTKLTSAKGDS